MQMENLAIVLVGCACVVAGVAAGLWSSGEAPVNAIPSAAQDAEPTYKLGNFTVADSRYRFEYELDRYETDVEGTLTVTNSHRGVSKGGAVLAVHYLSDSAVETFKSTHSDPRKCPAPFFNRYAQHRILIPATPEVERQLRRVNISDYQATENWRRFQVRGYCIRSAPVVTRDGKPGQLPRNMFDRCLTMVATALEVGAEPVMAPRRAASGRR